MSVETWKDIKGYEGFYQVSSFSRVRSLDRVDRSGRRRKGAVKKITVDANGYQVVNLCQDCKPTTLTIHRLVAAAFIPNPDNKPFINHKNGIKTDNRLINLEWCSPSENNLHAYDSGLKVSLKGEGHPKAKLTNTQVVEIYHSIGSQRKLAREYRVDKSVIGQIRNETIWKHLAK